MVFSHSLRVRYAECDRQGVVFNAHYLAYMDMSITELWREALGGYQRMVDEGIDIMVVDARLRFHKAAEFDDLLTLGIEVSRLGRTSISSDHWIKHEEDLLLEGTIHHVLVDLETRTKSELPDWIRDGLRPWSVGEVPGSEAQPA
jgi:acyl-CoA thioester hydrolase